MLTTDDEILMTKKEIKKLEEELATMDPTHPDNRFKYANKKSELALLERKLENLEEQKAISLGIPYKKKENNNILKKILRRS